MKFFQKLLVILTLSFLTACSQTSQVQNNSQDVSLSSDENILIVYFASGENSVVDVSSSASVTQSLGEDVGIVHAVANMIQQQVGGDMFAITTSVQYPQDIDDVIEYAQEEQDQDARPELTSHIENLDDYDVIFIGYPIWWYDMPQVMYSFFDEYDLSGKTIIPFCTHAGSQFSSTIDRIEELEPEANVFENGFTVSASDVENHGDDVNDQVKSWIEEIGL